jgi:hydrogenase nickel incorporation protein HypA/HybF
MHEYSIVQALIEQCESHALANHASAISKVVIKVGKLSGVEPYLLETAFESFKLESAVCREAELEMKLQPVEVLCLSCGTTSELEEHDYHCPKCNSPQLTVTDGEEMFLMQLEMA